MGKEKHLGKEEYLGEFLAGAKDRETGYLGSDSFHHPFHDEMLSSPPLQGFLAETQHIAPAVKQTVKFINVNHAGWSHIGT